MYFQTNTSLLFTTTLKLTCFITVFLFLGFSTYGQEIHPKVREQIDSMQVWMKNEIETKGTIDPAEMEAWNSKIKAVKEEVKKEEGKEKSSLSGEVSGKKIYKSGIAGSAWTVPDGEQWEVINATVAEGIGGYSVVIRSIELPMVLKAGERLRSPSYTSEASLLTNDQAGVTYKFTIIVSKANK